MSYKIEILETNNKLEISSSINEQAPSIEIVQNVSPSINVVHDIALLPSDFNDNTESVIKSFLRSGYGVSLFPSGDYLLVQTSGLQPSGNYSLNGHNHSSLDITDFNSSVSGLLPVKNIVSGSGISVSSNNSIFTVAVTGQFGLTAEQVDDRVSSLLSSGYGINLSYDDNNNLLTISTVGLQPTGNYSIVGHTHLSSSITDFVLAASGAAPVQTVAGKVGNVTLNKNDIGLFNIDNTSDLNKPISSATQNALDTKAPIANPTFTGSVGGITKSMVGLSNVDNTSDINKPISSLTQNALNLKSDVGHVHNSSNITDFISSVSGLLPVKNIANGSYVNISNNSGNFTVSVTGLQPSGNYANAIHNHSSSQITDFNSSVSGLLPITNVLAGTNISVIPSGTSYTVSVSGQLGLTSEQVDDRVAALLNAGNGININYNDPLDMLIISTTGLQPSGDYANTVHSHVYTDITNFSSGVADNLTTTLLPGSFINLDYNSSLDTLTISTSGLQPSGNYSVAGHSHTSSNITDFNSSVSGLLPVTNITGNSGILISKTGTTYNVSTSGLAYLSGANFSSNLTVNNIPVSVSGHTHTSNQITDSTSFGRNILTASSYADINKVLWQIPAGSGSPPAFRASAGGHYFIPPSLSVVLTINDPLTGSFGDFYRVCNHNSNMYVNIGGTSYGYGIDIVRAYNILTGSWQTIIFNNHTHTSNQITDFNTGVSGLLPSVSGSGYVNSNFSNNIYTISVSGLQPSGNYSAVGHTHTSSEITNFNSSVSGLLPVKDISAGTYINITNNSGIYTVNSTGEANLLETTVFNKTGSQIPKLSVVYINGGQGDQPTIALASASGEMTSSKTYGITAENINNMSTGKVIVAGALTGVNTDQFNPTAPQGDINGTTLWLSPTVAGGLTRTKPSAPYHMVSVGTVVRTHQNEGVIEVRIQNGFELEELHNVAISGLANNQFIKYDSSTSLWKNVTAIASDISDFNSSVSGLLPVTNILGGTNISVVPSGSVYTVSVSGQLGLTAEEVDDRVSSLLTAGSGINLNYNDAGNILTISTTGLQPSGNYSLVGHNHTSSDITDFNSSVSGLINGIYAPLNSPTFTGNIAAPSGNFTNKLTVNNIDVSVSGHSHVLNDITNINGDRGDITVSNSGLNWQLNNESVNTENLSNNLIIDCGIITPAGLSLWTPAALGSALALWLDAADAGTVTLNGSTVAQWLDKSGNGRHVAQATAIKQPTYTLAAQNSLNVLSFDGNNRSLFASSGVINITQPFSRFVAGQFLVKANQSVLLDSDTNNTQCVFYNGEVGTNWVVANGVSPAFKSYSYGTRDFLNHQHFHIIDGANSYWGIDGSSLTGPVDGGPGGQAGIRIGHVRTELSPSYAFNGRVFEIVLLSSVVSETDRQKLEGYLAWKWGLAANLPNNHPFKNSAPII